MYYMLRLKEVLAEKGISQGKLSRGADIALNTVRNMVKDPLYSPNMHTLRKVAEFLNVPLDTLYHDVRTDCSGENHSGENEHNDRYHDDEYQNDEDEYHDDEYQSDEDEYRDDDDFYYSYLRWKEDESK